jgi:hypothetical protein
MKHLAFVVLWLVGVAICYGLAVFISLEPDVTKWSADGRFWFACVAVFAGVFGAIFWSHP